MKKYLLLITLTTQAVSFLVAQSWFKVFPTNSVTSSTPEYYPTKVIQLTSGDFVLLCTPNINSSFKPIHIKKLSQNNGTVIWQTSLNEQPTNTAYNTILSSAGNTRPDIFPTNDGGFVLSGHSIDNQLNDSIINDSTYIAADRFMVLKYNADGMLLWRRTYSKDYYATTHSVKEMSNGLIVAIGTYTPPNATLSTAIFNTLNPVDGSDIVYKEYPGVYFRSFDVSNNNSYCINALNRSIYKLNMFGDTLWTKPNPLNNLNVNPICVSTPDGGCLYVRNDSIVKIDSIGAIVWKKKSRSTNFSRMQPAFGEQYMYTLSGVNPLLAYQGSKKQICAVITNSNCDSINAFYFPDSVTVNTGGYYGIQATDGSLVISGLYRNNLCILKTNPSGTLTSSIDSIFTHPASASLDRNNIQAFFKPTGSLSSYNDIGHNPFIAPINSGKSPIFANGLFLGAQEIFNGLYVAAETYNTYSDFSPGPLSNYDIANANNWDRVWKITLQQIRAHILDFLDNGIVDNPDPDIFEWPAYMNAFAEGKNNVPLLVNQPMAPFNDLNHNGIYEPNFGEYPSMKGDQMLWFAFNDNYQRHTQSLGNPLNVQVTGCAYEYDCSNLSNLYNSVFVEYNITNKSPISYDDFYFGQWMDYDLGNFGNDRVGCDTLSNSFYVYNGYLPDVDISGVLGYGNQTVVQSTTFLNKKMTSHRYWNNSLSSTNPGMSDPITSAQYYNYLTGRWADSTMMIYGNTGYLNGNNSPYYYAFDGNPSNASEWSECNAAWQAGDRRSMGVSGPYTFQRDSTINFALAYTFHNYALGNYPCFDFAPVRQQLNALSVGYQQNTFAGCETTLPSIPDSMIIHAGINNIFISDISIYPNPANTTLLISTTDNFQTVGIYNISGQTVFESPFRKNIDVSEFLSGIYFIEFRTTTGNFARRKFIKM